MKKTKMKTEQPKSQQQPEAAGSGKYDEKQIAYELWLTARGTHYYGNALYVAQDMRCIIASPEHRAVILRYLNGTQKAADHIMLQEAARLIYSPNVRDERQGVSPVRSGPLLAADDPQKKSSESS